MPNAKGQILQRKKYGGSNPRAQHMSWSPDIDWGPHRTAINSSPQNRLRFFIFSFSKALGHTWVETPVWKASVSLLPLNESLKQGNWGHIWKHSWKKRTPNAISVYHAMRSIFRIIPHICDFVSITLVQFLSTQKRANLWQKSGNYKQSKSQHNNKWQMWENLKFFHIANMTDGEKFCVYPHLSCWEILNSPHDCGTCDKYEVCSDPNPLTT